MTQPFPLYEELLEKVKKSQGQSIDLRRVCAAINNLVDPPSESSGVNPPNEHARNIFLLILHHELIETNGMRFKPMPYKGKSFEGGRGAMFTMNELPPVVQQMIGVYISLISEQ